MPVSFILTCVLLGVLEPAVAAGQQPTYAVTAPVAKAAALATAKTYAWTPSQPSPDKTIDAQIMAAVDRELSALGLTKMTAGKSDLLATYASVRRTDVDLKSEGAKTGRGTRVCGRHPRRGTARRHDPGDPVSRPDRHADRRRARQARARHQRGSDGDVQEIPVHRGEAVSSRETHIEPRRTSEGRSPR